MNSTQPRTGILLLQLGTPDSTAVPDVRRYLRQFLSDPRVIETPKWKWWFILNLFVLRTRPKQSAEKYKRIWNPQTGSPLLHYTKLQAEELQKILPGDFVVRFAMRIGNPGIPSAVREMIDLGIERIIVLTMYPQYSATTIGSAMDGLFLALMNERRVPALRTVPSYYAHSAYIDAMARLMEEEEKKLPRPPDHRVLSFHGLPQSYAKRGDPYPSHVEHTTQLLVERLGWREGTWSQTYQSVFGREEWLRPYTDDVLRTLAGQGKRRVFIATPGFTADCLETIDEIGFESREAFRHAGGEELHRCPCLNAHPVWIDAMRQIVMDESW